MKNSILILVLAVTFVSCAGTYQQASHTSSKSYLGMEIVDFKKIAGRKAKLEAMESGYTVYKMVDKNSWSGAYEGSKFFYFDSDGKLYKIDSGQFKQQRYQVEYIDR